MITPSVTEKQVFTALRAFILSIVDCEVIRLPSNRAAMPKGGFVSLQPLGNSALSTNITTMASGKKKILRPSQITIQVDCYGADAADRATAIAALLRDACGCDAFNVAQPADFTQVGISYVLGESALHTLPDVQPLYATDIRQMPIVNGEEQYESRYSFEAVLQVNAVLTIDQASALALSVGVKNVDRTYPP